ncbi:MAG TPA: Fe-S cluster assembly ATPase SufC, partial [Candidatus Binatia bacterium]|nr:Fe-S cluster assembly ATPase SufC [Candidatus Binatia bacterium]
IIARSLARSALTPPAMIVITHYQRLHEYIVPDHIHVLYDGRIVRSGGKELALELEKKGYDWIKGEAATFSSAP